MATVATSGIYSNQVSSVFWKEGATVPDDQFGAYTLVEPCESAYRCAVEHMSTAYPSAYADYLAGGGEPYTDPEMSEEEEEEPLGAPLELTDDGELVERRGEPGAPENRAEPFAPENRRRGNVVSTATVSPKPVAVKKPGTPEAKMEGSGHGEG